ncbi:MAG TPA: hypothetical protein VGG64_03455 [Pirellulales bacterium]|jgi:hypothetical protein
MKKLGMLALLLGVLGSAVVGCEPAKKKVEPAKPPAAAEEAKPDMPAADAPKAEAPAETK